MGLDRPDRLEDLTARSRRLLAGLLVTFTHSSRTVLQPTVQKTTWAAETRDPRLHICGLLSLTVPTSVMWITGYGEYCGSVLMLRTWMSWHCIWPKAEARSGTHQSINDQDTDQWRVRLNARVDSKCTHAMTCCFTTVNNLLLVLKLTLVFCF